MAHSPAQQERKLASSGGRFVAIGLPLVVIGIALIAGALAAGSAVLLIAGGIATVGGVVLFASGKRL